MRLASDIVGDLFSSELAKISPPLASPESAPALRLSPFSSFSTGRDSEDEKELRSLVNMIYRHPNDTDEHRKEALVAALADIDSALICYRAIAKARNITTVE